jgi:SpoVK/Ycf46/Vps4 family AAA+-type ATPase
MESRNRKGQPPPPDVEPLIQRLGSDTTWTELALPPQQQELLRSIALGAQQQTGGTEQRTRVASAPARTGVTALFVGSDAATAASAAEALANELGRDLYRVDLSRVVSKYIGETEKNLNRVFDAAEKAGWVLFFDEADALLGQRTSVTDSHDRYANLDISFLLDRLENFEGLAILATNRRTSLDDAIARRIKHIVDFPDG